MGNVAVRNKRAPRLLVVLNILKKCLDGSAHRTSKSAVACVKGELAKLDPPVVFTNHCVVMAVLTKEKFIIKDDNHNLSWNKDKADFPNIHTARTILSVIVKEQRAKNVAKRAKAKAAKREANVAAYEAEQERKLALETERLNKFVADNDARKNEERQFLDNFEEEHEPEEYMHRARLAMGPNKSLIIDIAEGSVHSGQFEGVEFSFEVFRVPMPKKK